MNESEKWDLGVLAVQKEYLSIPPDLRARVGLCVAAIKLCKRELHLIALKGGAAGICATCGGECCKRGNNHVGAVDLIAYLNDGREIFTPCFEREICPYLDEAGCIMEPEYRPFNCITFICEQVEDRLDHPEKERFYKLESDLRKLYRAMEQLFDDRFRCSLLGVCERQPQGKDREQRDMQIECKENI